MTKQYTPLEQDGMWSEVGWYEMVLLILLCNWSGVVLCAKQFDSMKASLNWKNVHFAHHLKIFLLCMQNNAKQLLTNTTTEQEQKRQYHICATTPQKQIREQR
jgi:hypothetical protein